MDAISAGVTTLANGLITLAHGAIHPWVALTVIIGLCLTWLASLEVEHMNRVSAGKPVVERH